MSDPNPHSADRSTLNAYFVIWGSQALSLLGSQAVQFAIVWWLTVRTGSPTVLAAATFVALAPQIVLGPLIGVLVDRSSRKRVMLISDGFVALVSLALAIRFAAGDATVGELMLALTARSIGAAFHGPALIASTSLMVPERHLTRVQGLNQMLQGGLGIVSAPLGAALFTALPMAGVMLVDVLTALIAIVPLAAVHVPRPRPSTDASSPQGILHGMLEGLRYVRSRPGMMPLIAIATLINLCLVPAFALLPLLVRERLGGEAFLLGGLTASFGAGVIVGGITLGVWGGFSRRIVTALSALFGLGAATLALGLVPAGVVAPLVAIFLVGVCAALTNGPIHALLQATVAPELQGRIFTLLGSFCGAMAPIGLLLAAPVAEAIGVASWYRIGGIGCLAMAALAFAIPSILRLESPANPAAAGVTQLSPRPSS